MDALFGLPRKRSAGVSHREPLFENLIFCDQLSVDQFVVDDEKSKSTPNVSIRECGSTLYVD